MKDFPLAQFRIIFTQFSSVSDDTVNAIADWAKCHISERGCECNDKLWQLMVAHLLQLRSDNEDGGVASGAVTAATVDKVNVSFQAPVETSAWAHWLNLTPYGQEFQVLFKRCSGGIKFLGGLPERDAFRSVYGIRGGRRCR